MCYFVKSVRLCMPYRELYLKQTRYEFEAKEKKKKKMKQKYEYIISKSNR